MKHDERSRALLDAVGDVLRDRFAEIEGRLKTIEKQVKAARIAGISRLKSGELLIVHHDGSTRTVPALSK